MRKTVRIVQRSVLLAVCSAAVSCMSSADPIEARVAEQAHLRGPGGRELQSLAALRPATTAALGTLRSLAEGHSASRRNFADVQELDKAVVGDGLPMYMIGLQSLRQFQRGADPVALLVHQNSVLLPVSVGSEVRVAAVMSLDPDSHAWVPTAFGRATLARASIAMRDRVRSLRSRSENHVLVEVPALVIRLLGHDEDGVFYLTPLRDIPEAHLVAGTSLEASELLDRLVPMARQLNESLLN